MIRRFCGVVFSLVLMGSVFGSQASAEVVDRIVAIVNNDIVTLVELRKETKPYVQKVEASTYSDEKKLTLLGEIDEQLLHALIDRALTQQEAKRYQLSVSDGEVNNAIENIMQSKMLSREDFEAALGREGLAFDEYKETIRKQILHTKIINNAVKSKVIITDSEIKKQYELDAAQNTGKKKYQLRNILMDNEEQLAAVKKLLDENKNFADLAKQYSMAPNASDGGELGLFDINNFSQILKENISKLEKGEYTDVISTPQGFQVFYVDDIVSGGGKTYEQARDEIHKTLYEKAADAKFQSWLESLKKKAHIKIML